ncbi:hypothetical protein M3Y99_00545200 [Aphelenchoides fujianensis]|nr:hypothetical protein M3Y99_00545200 [Aphelenchoides fujianensis]
MAAKRTLLLLLLAFCAYDHSRRQSGALSAGESGEEREAEARGKAEAVDEPKVVEEPKEEAIQPESGGSSHFFLYFLILLVLVGISYVYRKKLIGYVAGSRRSGRRSGAPVRYRRLSTGENTIE